MVNFQKTASDKTGLRCDQNYIILGAHPKFIKKETKLDNHYSTIKKS